MADLIEECLKRGPSVDGWFHIEDYEALVFTRADIKKAMEADLIKLQLSPGRARWTLRGTQSTRTLKRFRTALR